MSREAAEGVRLTRSDLLARIQVLEVEQGNGESPALPDDVRVADLNEKIAFLDSQIRDTQDPKLQALEKRISETHSKLIRARGNRYLDTDDDDSVFDEERTFPDNTFSFFLLTRYPICEKEASETGSDSEEANTARQNSSDYLCLPFWLALSILVVQLTIYSLALQNAVDLRNPDNPFQFPINVDPPTRAAEVCLANVKSGFALGQVLDSD